MTGRWALELTSVPMSCRQMQQSWVDSEVIRRSEGFAASFGILRIWLRNCDDMIGAVILVIGKGKDMLLEECGRRKEDRRTVVVLQVIFSWR